MNSLLSDWRYAARLYRRTPGGSLIAVLVLSIGIAAFGAFLSLYIDLVVRPHPGFETSAQIATVAQTDGTLSMGLPYAIVERMGSELASIESTALASSRSVLVAESEDALIEMVSEQFFSEFRPRVALGRGLEPSDHSPDAEPVVVLSDRLWQERFGRATDVLGSSISVSVPLPRNFDEEQRYETVQLRIVGVMSRSLQGLGRLETALWVPLERIAPLFAPQDRDPLRSVMGRTYVRTRSGVSLAALERELGAHYVDQLTTPFAGMRLSAVRGFRDNVAVQRAAARQLEIFLAVSVLLAVVTAGTVSLFLLARAPARSRELGIRIALGASRQRIARQLAAEAGLLVVVSCVLGLILSVWLSAYIKGLDFMRDAQWRSVTLLDWRVLCTTATFLLALTTLISLAPICSISSRTIAATSKTTAARASLPQRLTGTVQLALSGAIGAAATAFAWQLCWLIFSNPGYQTDDLYAVDASGRMNALSGRRDQAFVGAARQREAIQAIPGVRAVGFGFPIPGNSTTPVAVRIRDPRDSANRITANIGSLDREFIELLDLELVRGRPPEFGETGVVLVNRTLARALWGHDEVIGEVLPGGAQWGSGGANVIGVLQDVSFEHPLSPVPPFLFTVLGSPGVNMSVLIEAQATAAELHQALDSIASDGSLQLQISGVRSLTEMRSEATASDRARGYLITATGAFVVVLAAFGYYGTQRYLVLAGRREYAIRAALGAGPAALGRLVVRRGMSLAAPGFALAGALAYSVAAWITGSFFGQEISPTKITTATLSVLALFLAVATSGQLEERDLRSPLYCLEKSDPLSVERMR